ncbi:hypothetical protein MTP99_012148 [Tenebrio molitor]|nr:hypothetical protein MTP99_012148 [Tenebrio molitor]
MLKGPIAVTAKAGIIWQAANLAIVLKLQGWCELVPTKSPQNYPFVYEVLFLSLTRSSPHGSGRAAEDALRFLTLGFISNSMRRIKLFLLRSERNHF